LADYDQWAVEDSNAEQGLGELAIFELSIECSGQLELVLSARSLGWQEQ
jgi:hypothetical protein